MITAYGSVGQAVEAIKAGAFDYIEKPFEQDAIRMIVDKAIGQATANQLAPRQTLYRSDREPGRFGLVGQSPEMHAIFAVIEKVADTPSTVLITGESGTGKELVAKALHEQSSRKDRAVHQDQLRGDPQDADGVASCSATRRARSPARPRASRAGSSSPTAARCSSTRSARSRSRCRSSCCARSRRASSSASAASRRSRSTSA